MIRSTRIVAAVIVVLTTTSLFAQSDAQKAFSQIKSLNGSWEGKTANGDPVQVSFREVSGGSAVMSEILGKEDMISMFNLDGPDRLLITHYCGVGNQPRMQASLSPDGKMMTFTYLDATNLATPDAGHMQTLVLALVDANHHTEEWTFRDHDKEIKQFFDLHRKTM
jgi:hypothetical protein